MLETAYTTARESRVAATKPYPTNKVSRALAKATRPPRAPANRGALPANNPPSKILVQCGFAMWSHNTWARGKSVIRTNQFVFWEEPEAHELLIHHLCNKYKGTIEVQPTKSDDKEIFRDMHFPFCKLGTKQGGSVEDHESFVDFLKREKAIDLIFDRDTFERLMCDSDEDEEDFDKEETPYNLRGGKHRSAQEDTHASPKSNDSFNGSLPSPTSILRTVASHQLPTGSPAFPTPLQAPQYPETKDSPTQSPIEPFADDSGKPTHPPFNKEPSEQHDPVEPAETNVIFQNNPPCEYFSQKHPFKLSQKIDKQVIYVGRSNAILDPNDLTWERFGTIENIAYTEVPDAFDWVDGVCYDLEPNGLTMTQRMCCYKVNYHQCLKMKPDVKVISAEILESGKVFPMIAQFSRIRRDLSQFSYAIWPCVMMRLYAAARQLMAQFSDAVKQSNCGILEKNMAKKLRVRYNLISIISLCLDELTFSHLDC